MLTLFSRILIGQFVDSTGVWPDAGLFAALEATYSGVAQYYERTKDVGDLKLGIPHVMPVKAETIANKPTLYYKDGGTLGRLSIALLPVLRRDQGTRVFDADAITSCFERLASLRAQGPMSLHLPQGRGPLRGSQGNQNKLSYALERMQKRYLCQRGIPVYIYYWPRKRATRPSTRISYPFTPSAERRHDEAASMAVPTAPAVLSEGVFSGIELSLFRISLTRTPDRVRDALLAGTQKTRLTDEWFVERIKDVIRKNGGRVASEPFDDTDAVITSEFLPWRFERLL